MDNIIQAKIEQLSMLEEDLNFLGYVYMQQQTDEDRHNIGDQIDEITNKILELEYNQ